MTIGAARFVLQELHTYWLSAAGLDGLAICRSKNAEPLRSRASGARVVWTRRLPLPRALHAPGVRVDMHASWTIKVVLFGAALSLVIQLSAAARDRPSLPRSLFTNVHLRLMAGSRPPSSSRRTKSTWSSGRNTFLRCSTPGSRPTIWRDSPSGSAALKCWA